MLTLLTTFTSIAIAVPAPRDLQSEDAKGLQHDKEAPSLFNGHQAEGADKFSPPGNGSAAASKHEIALVAPVDVGYHPCYEDVGYCKKWCAKNTYSWPQKCSWSKYCDGCTPCASVDDEQAFCLTVTAPWATKCNWEKCHGHIQCSDGTVPCESESSCSKSIVFNPTVEIFNTSDGTTSEAELSDAIASCAHDSSSEACYIATVGCAPNAWDVSAVKSLPGSMFYYADSFNQDLADWDVSAVTSMKYAFYGATSFNQDLADWDVSSVEVLGGMFYNADSFNQDLADWDVSAVTSMGNMFYQATSFNHDFADWDVSAVKDMAGMFGYAKSFNQGLADWDVSAVKDMWNMFYYATSFNQDLADWDVSAMSSMNSFFGYATSFNQDLADWDVSAVEGMNYAFYQATSFNQDLADWDVSSVGTAASMFKDATSFNQDLTDWDVSAFKKFSHMFKDSPMSCNSVPPKLQTGTSCTA